MRFLKVSEHILHLCMIPPPACAIGPFSVEDDSWAALWDFPLSVPVSLNLPQRRPAMNAPERMAFRVRVRMWACAVKVNSEAADLFMSCGAFVNFSTVWRGAILTIRPCVCVHGPVCVFVCASHNCQSEKLVFLSPQLLHSSCLSLFLSTTPSPPPPCLLHFFFFSLLESLLAQEPSFIHAPGPSMPFSAGCQELLFKN